MDIAILNVPPDGGAGGPVVWFETYAAWENNVMVYEDLGGNNWKLAGTVAKNGEGGRAKVFSLRSSTTFRSYAIWMLHKKGPPGGLPWNNSPLKLRHIGNNVLVDPRHPEYRSSAVVIGSEDSSDGDFNDGVMHFTYGSFVGSANVRIENAALSDGWMDAPKQIQL